METTSQPKKLYRSRDRILGGVLAGFSEYIYADKTVVRLLYALIYIIAWIVIPERPLEH